MLPSKFGNHDFESQKNNFSSKVTDNFKNK